MPRKRIGACSSPNISKRLRNRERRYVRTRTLKSIIKNTASFQMFPFLVKKVRETGCVKCSGRFLHSWSQILLETPWNCIRIIAQISTSVYLVPRSIKPCSIPCSRGTHREREDVKCLPSPFKGRVIQFPINKSNDVSGFLTEHYRQISFQRDISPFPRKWGTKLLQNWQTFLAKQCWITLTMAGWSCYFPPPLSPDSPLTTRSLWLLLPFKT